MKALSIFATIVSVLCFPLAFLVLLYPQLVSPKGRWRGFSRYMGISMSMLLLAAITAPDPKIAEGSWGTWDWVVVFGLGLIALGYIAMRHWWGATREHLPHSQARPKGRKRKNRC